MPPDQARGLWVHQACTLVLDLAWGTGRSPVVPARLGALRARATDAAVDARVALWLNLAEAWAALDGGHADRIGRLSVRLASGGDRPSGPEGLETAAFGLEERFWLACTQAHLQMAQGAPNEALAQALIATDLAQRSGLRALADSATLVHGDALIGCGDLDAAIAVLERRTGPGQPNDPLQQRLKLRTMLAQLLANRVGDARTLAGRWIGPRRPGATPLDDRCRLALALMALEDNHADEALRLLAEGSEQGQGLPARPADPYHAWALARLAVAQHNPEAALGLLAAWMVDATGHGPSRSAAETTAVHGLMASASEAMGDLGGALASLRQAQAACLLWVAEGVQARLQSLTHASRPPAGTPADGQLEPPRETRRGDTGLGSLDFPFEGGGVGGGPARRADDANPAGSAVTGSWHSAPRPVPHTVGPAPVQLHAQRLLTVAEAACRAAALVPEHPDVAAGRLLADALADRLSPGALTGARAAPLPWLAQLLREIRDPVQGVLGLTALLELSALDGRWRVLRAMGAVDRRSPDASARDTDELADLAEGRLQLRDSALDLTQLLDGLRNTYARVASARGLELRSDWWALPQRPVWVDGLRLQQVLGHLLANAVRLTRRGHVVLRCHATPQPDGHLRLRLAVADTGPGLDRRWRDALRPDLAWPLPPPEADGGRGLPFSQRMVALMGGQLWIESEPGLGCQVGFELDLGLRNGVWVPMRAGPADPLSAGHALVRQGRWLA